MIRLDLQRRAYLYTRIAGTSIDDPIPFDGGDDGSVWYSDRRSVIKAFLRKENYFHECECYRRIQEAGLGLKVLDFNVPEFLECSDELLVIEMGTVFPPYILDFGKAYLSDPNWPEHVLGEWHERMADWWGDEVKRIKLALAALRRCGIWYYDAKPGNVMLADWDPPMEGDT